MTMIESVRPIIVLLCMLQVIKNVDLQQCKQIDMVLAIDVSGSIVWNNEDDWKNQQNFAKNIVDIVPDNSRIAVMEFRSYASVLFDFNSDKEAAKNEINKMKRPSNNAKTSIVAALKKTNEIFSKEAGNSKVLVLLTDGSPTVETKRVDITNEAGKLKSQGVKIITVAVTTEKKMKLLQKISTKDEWVVTASDYFQDVFKEVQEKICDASMAADIPEVVQPDVVIDCGKAVDLVLILDSSGSVKDHWNQLQNFAIQFVNSFSRIDQHLVHLGIIYFGNRPKTVLTLEQSYQDKINITQIILAESYTDDNTNTADALKEARTEVFKKGGDRADISNQVVIITDGKSTWNSKDTVPEAEELQKIAKVFVVGVTNEVNTTEIKSMSSYPHVKGQNYFLEPNFEALDKIFLHSLLVDVCSDDAMANDIPVFNLADATILLDSSGSINFDNGANWDKMRNFAVNLFSKFKIGRDLTRAGMIQFSDEAKIVFDFNENPMSIDSIATTVNRKMPYSNGIKTNIVDALNTMVDDMYTPARGDRANQRDIAFFITDGKHTATNNLTSVQQAAQRAHDRNIEIFAIGIGNQINQDELKKIASDDSKYGYRHVFHVNNIDELTLVLQNLTLIDAAIQEGVMSRDVIMNDDIGTELPVCMTEIDIAFMVDLSMTNSNEDIEKIKSHLDRVVSKLDVNAKVNVGIYGYGNGQNLDFVHLGEIKDLNDLKNEIPNIKRIGGTTTTAFAVRHLSLNVFNGKGNDRTMSPNLVVLYSDGSSSNSQDVFTYAQQAKQAGMHIIVVSTSNINTNREAYAVASYPHEVNIIDIASFDGFSEEMERKLHDHICNNVNECDIGFNPCSDSAICVDGIGFYACFCPPGQGGKNCELPCTETKDIIFAIDESGSISQQPFYNIMHVALSLVEMLPLPLDSVKISNTLLGMVTFSDKADTVFYLNSYQNKIEWLNAVMIPYFDGGKTFLATALTRIRNGMFLTNRGDRNDRGNLVVLFTDGYPYDIEDSWNETMKLRQAGSSILSIGYGDKINRNNLDQLGDASITLDHNLSNDEQILDVYNMICNNVDNCKANPCRFGGVCNNKMGGYSCSCSESYTGKDCSKKCRGDWDIIFAVDSSVAVRREKFGDVLKFFAEIVDYFEISETKTQVGMINVGDNAVMEFPLNSFQNKKDLKAAIKYVKYSSSKKTNITSALVMANTMFTKNYGARSESDKIIIFFTSGVTNKDETVRLHEVARKLKIEGNIRIMVTSGVANLNKMNLMNIASYPKKSNMILVNSISSLMGDAAKPFDFICNGTNECNDYCDEKNTQVCIDGHYTQSCVCKPGFAGKKCEQKCLNPSTQISNMFDILFLVDTGGSNDELIHHLMMTFTRRVVNMFQMKDLTTSSGWNQARFALITYNNETKTHFSFNDLQRKDDVLNSISFVRDVTKRTNLLSGLKSAKEMFKSSSSGRQKVLFILSDGGASPSSEEYALADDIKKSDTEQIMIVDFSQRNPGSAYSYVNGGDNFITYEFTPFYQHVVNANDVDMACDKILGHLCEKHLS